MGSGVALSILPPHFLQVFSFESTKLSKEKKSGDNSKEDTPVPISNTEVKLLSADDTWWEAAWENRTLPLFLQGPMVKRLRHRPFTAVTRVRFSMGSPFNCTLVQFFFMNLTKAGVRAMRVFIFHIKIYDVSIINKNDNRHL